MSERPVNERWFKPYEFWNPRLFELPYYLYLGILCLKHRLPLKWLAKANYALDHGEIGIGSKYQTQSLFPQSYFLPTMLLSDELSILEKRHAVLTFTDLHDFPIVLKPDNGSVGKGVIKISDRRGLDQNLPLLKGPYLLQKFTPKNAEYGVFFVRVRGETLITGINQKHFPTIRGDGALSIEQLAKSHYRYTAHWELFLKDMERTRVPDAGEEVQLSFIGSHTMGCMFTEASHLRSREIEQVIFEVCNVKGFNFGRLDVKADSEAAFKAGVFTIIEVNGVASLPTNMFDPSNSLIKAYGIFLQHGRLLVEIANEHRGEQMFLRPWKEILALVKHNQTLLNEAHRSLLSR